MDNLMDNFYHFTVHKAASSFFSALVEHPEVHKCITEYRPRFHTLHYELKLKRRQMIKTARKLQVPRWAVLYENYTKQTPLDSVPSRKWIGSWTSDYQTFKNTPKSEYYKGFYIYRDPRELVTSTYWSWHSSHSGGHPNRDILHEMDLDAGIKWTIDEMNGLGIFEAMKDWITNCTDERIKIFKFENFFHAESTQRGHIKDIFEWFGLRIPPDDALEDLEFSVLSGREREDEDTNAHYRNGGKDTYKKWMSNSCLEHFYKTVGDDYVDVLGYEHFMSDAHGTEKEYVNDTSDAQKRRIKLQRAAIKRRLGR